MIFTRNFARGCVGELIAETIGLSGTISLCILGRPYIYFFILDKLLDDEYTYKQLPNDPTTKIENKITKALKSIEEKKLITREQRLKLAPQHSTPPQTVVEEEKLCPKSCTVREARANPSEETKAFCMTDISKKI